MLRAHRHRGRCSSLCGSFLRLRCPSALPVAFRLRPHAPACLSWPPSRLSLVLMLAATATACFAAGRVTAHASRRQPVELSGAPLPVPLGTAGASSALPASLPPARELGLWAVYNSILKTRKFVDLTHAFDPNIPHWKGFEAETVATKYSYDSDGVCMCTCMCMCKYVCAWVCISCACACPCAHMWACACERA